MITSEVEELAGDLGVDLREADTLSGLINIVEAVFREGYVVLLKWDGERETLPVTAMVSGPPLGGDFFRRDDHSPEAALGFVLTELANHRFQRR